MPKPMRTRPVSAAQVRAYAGKAQEFADAAEAELAAGRFIAASSLAVHAGINAGDAVTGGPPRSPCLRRRSRAGAGAARAGRQRRSGSRTRTPTAAAVEDQGRVRAGRRRRFDRHEGRRTSKSLCADRSRGRKLNQLEAAGGASACQTVAAAHLVGGHRRGLVSDVSSVTHRFPVAHQTSGCLAASDRRARRSFV